MVKKYSTFEFDPINYMISIFNDIISGRFNIVKGISGINKEDIVDDMKNNQFDYSIDIVDENKFNLLDKISFFSKGFVIKKANNIL